MRELLWGTKRRTARHVQAKLGEDAAVDLVEELHRDRERLEDGARSNGAEGGEGAQRLRLCCF